MAIDSELLPHEDLSLGLHHGVTFEEFSSAFNLPESKIRAQLDVEQLEKEMAVGRAAITMTYQSRWRTEGLYAPWYRDPETDNPRKYNDPGAKIWSYAELIDPARVPVRQFDHDLHYTPVFPPGWLFDARILTINVGNAHELVLDGNHRLLARLRCYRGWQVGMMAYRIHCPTFVRLVPDIDYWFGPRSSELEAR